MKSSEYCCDAAVDCGVLDAVDSNDSSAYDVRSVGDSDDLDGARLLRDLECGRILGVMVFHERIHCSIVTQTWAQASPQCCCAGRRIIGRVIAKGCPNLSSSMTSDTGVADTRCLLSNTTDPLLRRRPMPACAHSGHCWDIDCCIGSPWLSAVCLEMPWPSSARALRRLTMQTQAHRS